LGTFLERIVYRSWEADFIFTFKDYRVQAFVLYGLYLASDK
jgi:hypothetical protein